MLLILLVIQFGLFPVRGLSEPVPEETEPGPIYCPFILPTGLGTWVTLPHSIPRVDVEGTIDFSPSVFHRYTPLPQSRPLAKYVPDNGRERTSGAQKWYWDGALAEFECTQEYIDGALVRTYMPTYDDDGIATPVYSSGGGVQQEQNCFEAYEWWFDSTGYHEHFLGSWCEGGEWET